MESNNTAYNQYLLCAECQFCPIRDSVTPDTKFYCRRAGEVQKVGICKYFKRFGGSNGDYRDK